MIDFTFLAIFQLETLDEKLRVGCPEASVSVGDWTKGIRILSVKKLDITDSGNMP